MDRKEAAHPPGGREGGGKVTQVGEEIVSFPLCWLDWQLGAHRWMNDSKKVRWIKGWFSTRSASIPAFGCLRRKYIFLYAYSWAARLRCAPAVWEAERRMLPLQHWTTRSLEKGLFFGGGGLHAAELDGGGESCSFLFSREQNLWKHFWGSSKNSGVLVDDDLLRTMA